MMRGVTVGVVLGALAAGCGGLASDVGDGRNQPNAQALSVQGAYVFQVDREWDRAAAGDVNFPDDELSESDYQPVTWGAAYSVHFLAEGTRVEILPADTTVPYRGSPTGADADRQCFALDEGTVAGGRFVVWSAGETTQAELTLFGSGLPVVRSARGRLTPAMPH